MDHALQTGMPTIKTILCPIDYSDETEHAVAHATAIARWYQARIVGLHVFQPVFYPVPGLATAGYVGEPLPERESIAEMEKDVAGVLRAAEKSGIPTEARVVQGDPARTIVAWSTSLPADLIVIGTHGASGFEHLVLGSVTEKVLRLARCPVMTIPPRARTTSKLPFKHILCPVDFSDQSARALEYALSIAQESDAGLTVLHVLESPSDQEPRTNRGFNVPEYGLFRAEEAKERLMQLIPESAAAWCTPQTMIAHGKPYREILGIATDASMDLIVMGVHGRNALDVMLFGSTTNQVVRRATCPVLTLRG